MGTCRPSPRSAHQAVFHKGYIYMWGGELTSPNQVPSPLSRDKCFAAGTSDKRLCPQSMQGMLARSFI